MGSLTTRSARITFLNCQSIQSDWDGIHIHGDQIEIIGGYWNENGQDVTDIGTFGACGVYVDGAFPCNDLVITGAVANDNKESGFGLASGAGTLITNCIARRNWAGGIVVGGSRGMVSNCYCEGNGLIWVLGHPFYSLPNDFRFIYSGINSLSGTEMIFTGNRCHDLKTTKSQKWGISAETAATGTNTNYLRLTGNMLHGNLTADTGVETATNVTTV
jgi:parallel beta-helix repeat protein